MTSRTAIDQFLSQPRIAMIGVSRDKKHFSRMLFADLRKRGYDIVPVNPGAADVEGVECKASIGDVHPPCEAALLMTPSKESAGVVEQCAKSGVKSVWLYRAVGSGSVSPEAVAKAHENGMAVIEGECPFMFLKDRAWYHSVHRGIRSLMGTLPK